MNPRFLSFGALISSAVILAAVCGSTWARDGGLPLLQDPLVPARAIECAPQVIAPTHNLAVYRGEPFERALMRLGHRQDWRRIEWRRDLPSAIDEAGRRGRPVVAVLMLQEYSQTSAPES